MPFSFNLSDMVFPFASFNSVDCGNLALDTFESIEQYLEECISNGSIKNAYRDILMEHKKMATDNGVFLNSVLVALTLFYVIMIFIGFTGNIMVICVVLCNRVMRSSPRNLFILNLAISDLILCVITQPLSLYRILSFNHGWQLGLTMCKLTSMVQGTNVYVSSMSITAIALDRFRLIMNPSKQDIRVKTVYLIIFFLWLLGFMLSTPLGFFTTLTFSDKRWVCTEITLNYAMRTTKLVYSILGMLLLYGTPVVLVSIAYAQICILVNRRGQQRERTVWRPFHIKGTVRGLPLCNQIENANSTKPYSTEAELIDGNSKQEQFTTRISDVGSMCSFYIQQKHSTLEKEEKKYALGQKRHRRTSLLLASVAICFACSWLPINIVNLLMDLKDLRFRVMSSNKTDEESNDSSVRPGQKDEFSLSKDSVLTLQAVCLLCVLISACINPMLYGWLNGNFRRRFKQLLHCNRKEMDETELSSYRKRASYALWPRSNSHKKKTRRPTIIISSSSCKANSKESNLTPINKMNTFVNSYQTVFDDNPAISSSNCLLYNCPVLLETNIDDPQVLDFNS